jgi:hypothetical protein
MTTENGQSPREIYLADLHAQVERLLALIAAVESEGENLAGGASVKRRADTQVRPDSFFGMTTPGAVRKFLEMCGKGNPQAAQAIADALVSGGLDKRENVETVLKNVYTAFKRGKDTDFVKIGKVWGLKEWYPNAKAADEKPTKPKHGKTRAKSPKAGKGGNGDRAPAPKSAYRTFMGEAMKSGKTMTQAAEEWRKRQKDSEGTAKLTVA